MVRNLGKAGKVWLLCNVANWVCNVFVSNVCVILMLSVCSAGHNGLVLCHQECKDRSHERNDP